MVVTCFTNEPSTVQWRFPFTVGPVSTAVSYAIQYCKMFLQSLIDTTAYRAYTMHWPGLFISTFFVTSSFWAETNSSLVTFSLKSAVCSSPPVKVPGLPEGKILTIPEFSSGSPSGVIWWIFTLSKSVSLFPRASWVGTMKTLMPSLSTFMDTGRDSTTLDSEVMFVHVHDRESTLQKHFNGITMTWRMFVSPEWNSSSMSMLVKDQSMNLLLPSSGGHSKLEILEYHQRS